MTSDTQSRDPIQRQFEMIHAKLDRLDDAIRGTPGNDDRPGIMVRMDRIEQAVKRQSRVVWMSVGAVVTALASGIVNWIAG